MEKVITSYVVIDELETLSYKLLAAEFSRRKDAENALRDLQSAYPESHVCELQAGYDICDPAEYERYQAHKSRLG